MIRTLIFGFEFFLDDQSDARKCSFEKTKQIYCQRSLFANEMNVLLDAQLPHLHHA